MRALIFAAVSLAWPLAAVGQPAAVTTESASAKIDTLSSEIAEFDKMRTPDSPAFVLLGVSPTQIQRPTTPKEVAASLSAFVTDGGSITIPKSLAVEVAPYWLWTRSKLSASEYAKGGFNNIGRNLTLSLGTTPTTASMTDPTGMSTASTNMDLAAGVRTRIYDGKSRGTCMEQVEGLQKMMSSLAISTRVDVSPSALAPIEDALLLEVPDFKALVKARWPETPEALLPDKLDELRLSNNAEYVRLRKPYVTKKEFLDRLSEQLAELKQAKVEAASSQFRKLDELFVKCAKIESARAGFLLDFALASAWRFADGDAKRGDWSARAAWITGAWESSSWNIVGLGRYVGRSSAPDAWEGYGDFGARGIFTRKSYAGSVEAIWRHRFQRPDGAMGGDNTYRIALALDVLVSEGSWATVTFGRDFSTGGLASLFALANVKFGFGQPQR